MWCILQAPLPCVVQRAPTDPADTSLSFWAITGSQSSSPQPEFLAFLPFASFRERNINSNFWYIIIKSYSVRIKTFLTSFQRGWRHSHHHLYLTLFSTLDRLESFSRRINQLLRLREAAESFWCVPTAAGLLQLHFLCRGHNSEAVLHLCMGLGLFMDLLRMHKELRLGTCSELSQSSAFPVSHLQTDVGINHFI